MGFRVTKVLNEYFGRGTLSLHTFLFQAVQRNAHVLATATNILLINKHVACDWSLRMLQLTHLMT